MTGRMKVVCVAWTVATATVGLGTARADVEDFSILSGATYSSGIVMQTGLSSTISLTGGSIGPSSLNGQTLPYVFCVDIPDEVFVPGDYADSIVTNNGYVNNDGTAEAKQTAPLTNAGAVAWLLDNFGTGGQGPAAMALQAAIWTLIYNDTSNTYTNGGEFVLDTTVGGGNSSAAIAAYNYDLGQLNTFTGGNYASLNTAQWIGSIQWISPNDGTNTVYQGLVTAPEPAILFLLCIFLSILGLVELARRKLA